MDPVVQSITSTDPCPGAPAHRLDADASLPRVRMSHISFSSIRIDTTRIAAHAEPAVPPSPARSVLYWHAVIVAWALASVDGYRFATMFLRRKEIAAELAPYASFVMRAMAQPLVMCVMIALVAWTLLRRGGLLARFGSALLGTVCGIQGLVMLIVAEGPLTMSSRAYLYATVAFLAHAAFGSTESRS
jgi:hypothetical protein